MPRAVELMARWGFQHKTLLTWMKPQFGIGSYFRNSTEHALFGVKGKMRTRSDSIATHFDAPLDAHSEKPERFYEIRPRRVLPAVRGSLRPRRTDELREPVQGGGGVSAMGWLRDEARPRSS